MKLENLPNHHFISINDFIFSEQTKPLGSGSFGVVRKAWHKMTNKIYAIKIIEIDENLNQPQILLLSREIAIHYQLDHPHVVKLWAVLEENDKIYMVMDYAEGGNLFNYLNKKKMFTEMESFKIFYQVLQAIHYMHKFDVFHRDIKPENILLDHQMNAKLCDFGWVADEINRKRTTFCGTYEYMAPQMVQDIPYDYKIDIWALGILLYELNHGKAPFPAESAEIIKQRFQKGKYQMKEDLSQECKKLISNILQFDPSLRYEIQDIKNSEWVQKHKKIYSHQIGLGLLKNPLPQISGEINIEKSNSNLLKNILSKDDKFLDENKSKKYRKKHKTLEEEDLNCLTQNFNFKISKHGSTKDCNKFYETAKENYNFLVGRQNSPKENIALRQNINKFSSTEQKNEGELKKKKLANKRTHTRTGTQANQVLRKKLSKIIFQSKMKLLTDETKKKPSSKRT